MKTYVTTECLDKYKEEMETKFAEIGEQMRMLESAFNEDLNGSIEETSQPPNLNLDESPQVIRNGSKH